MTLFRDAVRLRTFLRTRTLPWREIAMFEDRQAVVGIWPFEQLFARLYGPRAIWIVLEDGTQVQTDLTYLKPAEIEDGGGFLHQVMSGAMGARFMRVATNAGEDLHMIGSQQRCRAALIELRQSLVASRS